MAQIQSKSSAGENLLPREVERELAIRWRDHRDYEARDKIIKAYQMLAHAWAQRSARSGLSAEDLAQEANIGLLSALDRFDPDLGYGFGTFARYHVISRIQIYTLENVAPLRIFNTGATKALLSRYNRTRREIEEETGEPLNEEGREEICRRLGIERWQLDRFEMATASTTSVDAGAGNPDEDVTRPHQLADTRPDPENEAMESVSRGEVADLVNDILEGMDKRDAEVIRARHLSDPPATLDRLSRAYGISRERVRQIELRALRKLAEGLRDRGINSVSDILHVN
jgi:RNA polymerase sigma-32 factor